MNDKEGKFDDVDDKIYEDIEEYTGEHYDYQSYRDEKKRKEEKQRINDNKFSFKRFLLELVLYIVLLFACVYIVPKYVIQRTVVDGESMENSLYDEENLLVDKISYRFIDPKRFEIVVFYPYGRIEDPDDYYVKRIIGLPGETVQIIDDDIYINGEIIEENFGKDPMTYQGTAAEPITLGEEQFFVLICSWLKMLNWFKI